ncbi:hypothetical protein SO802_022731 [Lithocarpus litseifolius]|uniref:Telomere-associated protein Rif1 N-terminal domain-containing protein n=1 Tax=Lithocarpus litseifolius TaxID=425828 RepID=A0AAW2C5P7_9ROSI
MKSVCNLGVWCISIQQFNAPFLDSHCNSLLQAVVHALDNPIGSLSTTFEAIQALIKLASNLSERMRDSSHLWAPPIYRRLLSFDKERDMSERCLMKIKPIILPPPLVLSKVLVQDMKKILLTKMKELLNLGMKVQAIHAWGWFIRLLGSYAMKNRQLTNEMLKIPENTFSVLNPQVQIASQFAWECLIDALIHPPIVSCVTNGSKEEKGVQHLQKSRESSDKIQARVRLELEKPSTNYDDIMLCLGTVLRFIKKICEDVSSEGSDSSDLHHTCLRFIDAVTEELQPATLESPLYKFSLDLKTLTIQVSSYRYLKVLCTKLSTEPPTGLLVTSRLFSALAFIISCLHMKQDILLFIEIISCSVLQWVSHIEIWDESTKYQLQLFWTEILNCLRSSQPPIIFDSVLLKLQAPLLEKTLEHPNPSISEPTITFWNSTYGEQIKLDYPQSLLHVLDKLSRNGKINLCKRSLPYLERCRSRLGVNTALQRHRVTATHNMCSKRVEFVEDTVNQLQHEEKLSPRLKRKSLELTEHQKEVRRAQQGRERDCSGHGPGIQTYTSVDFSQGNEDSQDSQEIRDPESIMEMLKRAT